MEDSKLNSTIVALAKRYYDFILKYENYISNQNSKEDAVIREKKLSTTELQVLESLRNVMEEEYVPWRCLTKGEEINELEKIFDSGSNIIQYFRLIDYLSDSFFERAEQELKKYFDINGIKKDEDEIINEVFNLDKRGTFDPKIFSKETIKERDLMIELDSIWQDLQTYYDRKTKKSQMHEVKDIVDDSF